MSSHLSVFVTPRDGLHYQSFLYRDIEASGVRVHYDQGPTPSQSVNVILKPAMLLWHRLHGCRILHVHWLFQFSLPWALRRGWARLLMEGWLRVNLRLAVVLGYKIVWTAHDLVPHTQIFADDLRARNALIAKASLVIALSEATASELRGLGARRVRVIPMGPYSDPYPVTLSTEEARDSFGFDDHDLVVSLIGRIEPYKGADTLLLAVAKLPTSSRIKVLIAGICVDEAYREQLLRLAAEIPGRAVTRLEWIPDDDLARYFQATDVAVFPFREITNSASVLLAQSFGTPVAIPDLPTLTDLPEDTVIRFDPARDSLLAVLERVETLSDDARAGLGAAGYAWAHRTDWKTVAHDTIDAYRSTLSA